jgi:hypothetical protein
MFGEYPAYLSETGPVFIKGRCSKKQTDQGRRVGQNTDQREYGHGSHAPGHFAGKQANHSFFSGLN